MTEQPFAVGKRPVPRWLVIGALGIVAGLFAGPFILKDNPLAQGLYGLLVAIVTTLISVYATRHYARATGREELTRYGLQAWRNLDSLEIKVAQQGQLEPTQIGDNVLEGWLLDINQAKWAWRDLLREVFELQARLQAETEEVAARYRVELAAAGGQDARSLIESRQAAELAKLSSKAPLPLRVPAEVNCPRCGTPVTAQLGESPGDTAWPTCPNCQARFAVHRQADVKVAGDRVPVRIECPACRSATMLRVPNDRASQFVTTCPTCHTHIQFSGSASSYKLDDLKPTNAEFNCPECGETSQVWVSPGRTVRFLANCVSCRKAVQIDSDGSHVQATKVGGAA